MPTELKIKNPCPAFTGQTAGGNSTKLNKNDQYKSFAGIFRPFCFAAKIGHQSLK
jgi:hypothetical protein